MKKLLALLVIGGLCTVGCSSNTAKTEKTTEKATKLEGGAGTPTSRTETMTPTHPEPKKMATPTEKATGAAKGGVTAKSTEVKKDSK